MCVNNYVHMQQIFSITVKFKVTRKACDVAHITQNILTKPLRVMRATNA